MASWSIMVFFKLKGQNSWKVNILNERCAWYNEVWKQLSEDAGIGLRASNLELVFWRYWLGLLRTSCLKVNIYLHAFWMKPSEDACVDLFASSLEQAVWRC